MNRILALRALLKNLVKWSRDGGSTPFRDRAVQTRIFPI